MNRTFAILLVGILTLTTVLLTAAFFYFFENVEETVPGQPSGLARQNPYLALERLFTRSDIEATTYAQLPTDPYRPNDPDQYTAYDADTIIWMTPKRDIDPIQLEKMHGWVSIGRHLIIVAPDNVHDPLITAFGLDFNRDPKIPDPDVQSTTYTIENHNRNTIPWTNPQADYEFYDTNQNLIALSQPYEDGRLTFFASPSIFTNNHIGENDHARLALDLAKLPLPNSDDHDELYEDNAFISIVKHGQRISWLAHVAKIFWPLVATLTLLLILALALGRQRFGPLQINRTDHRRSRLEHIHAVGRFLWKNSSEHVLLDATRTALLEKLTRRRPAITTLHGNARYEIIADELNITPIAAKRLFESPVSTRPGQFLESIRILENFRRAL